MATPKSRAKKQTRIADVRKELESRYIKAFGIEWPHAPWNKDWNDVLAEAKAADQDYVGAARVLQNAAVALTDAVAFVRQRGLHIGTPSTGEYIIGRTWAEAMLGTVMAPAFGVLEDPRTANKAKALVNDLGRRGLLEYRTLLTPKTPRRETPDGADRDSP